LILRARRARKIKGFRKIGEGIGFKPVVDVLKKLALQAFSKHQQQI